MMKNSSIFLLMVLLIPFGCGLLGGCSPDNQPTLPPETPPHLTSLGPRPFPPLPDNSSISHGSWDWTWSVARADSLDCGDFGGFRGRRARQGSARLLVQQMAGDTGNGPVPGAGSVFSWQFADSFPWPCPGDSLALIPADAQEWLGMTLVWPDSLDGGTLPGHLLLPLPRISLNSVEYADLVQFLAEMTRPRFNSIVTHWPGAPIPVRLAPAESGQLDLADCLTEAVGRWNAGRRTPWFEIQDSPGWGVRLVHFQGTNLHPPMQARLTWPEEDAHPLLVQILVGDTYDVTRDRPYAVRAFVHELGHALFLWGHSRDRDHVLWASGPPLVDAPSLDERKAAQLWHGLPEGLDLGWYFSAP